MNQKIARVCGAGALALAFCVPPVLPTTALPLLTFAKPPGGTAINIKWGQEFKFGVTGVAGCTFDHMTNSTTGGVIFIENPSGTDEKGTTVTIAGLKVGTTNFSIMTNNGTCPPATHTYPVTVSADPIAMSKFYGFMAKNQLKGLKFDLKDDYVNWATLTKAKYADIIDGTVGFDQGISDLRDITNSSIWDMHMHAQGRLDDFADLGTSLLDMNAVAIGEGPTGFFPGGGGIWDLYHKGTGIEVLKTVGAIDKTSKIYRIGFAKNGFPQIEIPEFRFPRLYSAGPTYATQTNRPAVVHYPEFTLVYASPTTNAGANNGKISITGYTDSSFGANIDLKITRVVNGNPDEVTTFSAPVNGWGFTHEFTGLAPGRYSYEGRYGTDIIAIGGVAHVGKL